MKLPSKLTKDSWELQNTPTIVRYLKQIPFVKESGIKLQHQRGVVLTDFKGLHINFTSWGVVQYVLTDAKKQLRGIETW